MGAKLITENLVFSDWLFIIILYFNMAFLKYFQRVRRIDDLIDRKATGTPDELARKVNLSRSVLMEYLREMKEIGFPVKFCRNRNSYYYDGPFEIGNYKVFGKVLSKEDQRKVEGGCTTIDFHALTVCRQIAC